MKPILRHPHSNPLLFFFFFFLLILLLIQITSSSAQNLSPSQIKTLLRIQHILEYPPSLSLLNNITTTTTNNNNINLCYLPSTSSLSISCLGTRITQLAITGNTTSTSSSSSLLSPSFSLDSLFTTLSRLPNLTSLSLLSLGLWGPLPPKIDRLSSLRTLNLTSNHLSGPIPSQLSSLSALQYLDLSSNHLAGTLPPSLFSLPSLQYLDLSANTLTGALPPNLTCAPRLAYVDVSANRLLGALPSCLASNSSTRVVLNSWNCMAPANSTLQQHAPSFCSKDPIAAILPPVVHKDEGRGSAKSRVGLILGIVGGILGGAAFLGLLVLLVFKKAKSETTVKSIKLPKPVMAKASVQVSPRTPTETRHMSQAVRIGTLGLTPYRVFTMEELDEATNGFDPINFISQGPRGQFYRGWLHDGSTAVIRCLKLKQKLSSQSLAQYMDVISKLRHVNLVSFLGHCIPTDQENSITDNTIFLVFEYVSNGTLRSHLTEWRKREMLKWPQRVAAVIGVARGIQFLHTVTVPGLVGNDLSIENILLDETLTAKISNYNLPMLSRSKNNKVGSESPFGTVENNDHGSGNHSLEHGEKEDVYQLGLILLEIITGKPTESTRELDALKVELQESLSEAPAKLREITDPTIRGTFAVDSLQTLVTVALNCVAKDHRERPSIDDILWNLQYSVQVQDGWTSSDSLSIHSYN